MIKPYEVKDLQTALNDVEELEDKIYKILTTFINRFQNKVYAIDYAHEILECVEQLDDIIWYLNDELAMKEDMINSLVSKVAKLPNKRECEFSESDLKNYLHTHPPISTITCKEDADRLKEFYREISD